LAAVSVMGFFFSLLSILVLVYYFTTQTVLPEALVTLNIELLGEKKKENLPAYKLKY